MIAQAQWSRRFRHLRGCNPSHLHRNVTAQRERVARHRIGKAQQTIPRRTAAARRQTAFKFGNRRGDPRITIAGQHIYHRPRYPRRRFRLRRKSVAEAFR